ncbi:Holliday junction branch migration protein RuvA [Verrucomicrobia bacterium]|jgi:holliday junction DNA helicase RuvA|nr:Holliday junction branch migration protein RuvA [Verrucomicrobiota bacterium]MDG1889743.1 Holliday junction branch migration protein RuvA [Verrucomicrobiota bacterium]
MIDYLEGKLVEAHPTYVVVDVRGMGYHLQIPVSSYERLPEPGKEVKILTHLSIREDAHLLYGFMTRVERDLFRLLVQAVSGIGPKIAMNVLSGMTPVMFKGAVTNHDVKALARIPGLGKKTAERIVVELKDKFGKAGEWEAQSDQRAPSEGEAKVQDAVSALVSLGYKPAEALKRVKAALAVLGEKAEIDRLVRAGLQQ